MALHGRWGPWYMDQRGKSVKIKRIWPPTPDLALRPLLHPITDASDEGPDNDEVPSDGFADTVRDDDLGELQSWLHPERTRDAHITPDRDDDA